MTGSIHIPARRMWPALAVAVAAAAAGGACDGDPQGPAGGDNVRIDLAPYFSPFGSSRAPCSEADIVRLRVTELTSGRVQNLSAPVPPCTAIFTVTVDGGPTEFITLVSGDRRPLLADIDTIDIQSDGWSASVELQPVSALLVTVDTSADTTGVAATLSYAYTVTSEESGTSDPFAIAANSTDIRFALSAGDVHVQLFGFGTCTVTPDSVQTVAIPVDSLRVGAATFGVDCNSGGSGPIGPMGTVRVTTMTTGTGGPDPYRLSVAGRDTLIGLNDTVVVSGVPVGNQSVELENSGTCSVIPASQQTTSVTENDTTDIGFAIDAVLPCGEIGSVEVTTTTNGSGGPPGYDFTIDGGTSILIGVDDTVTVDSLLAGTHTVELLNFEPCSVGPDTIQAVDVVTDSTARVMYAIDCPGVGVLGAIGVITRTSGPDPGGYEFQIPPDVVGSIAANDTVIVDSLAPGPRSVALDNTAPCLVTSANPDAVTVVAGDTVFVVFDVECSPQLQVQTMTVGTSFDPDGYTATVVDSARSLPIGVNDSVLFGNLSPGSHTVQLDDVAANCDVFTGNTQTAVVGTIGTSTVQFGIECFTQNSLAPVRGDSGQVGIPSQGQPRRSASRSRRSS